MHAVRVISLLLVAFGLILVLAIQAREALECSIYSPLYPTSYCGDF